MIFFPFKKDFVLILILKKKERRKLSLTWPPLPLSIRSQWICEKKGSSKSCTIALRKSLQTCLASKASLKLSRSMNPIPPICLAFVIVFQSTQWTFFSLGQWPHQKVPIREWRPLANLGSFKQAMVKVGMHWSMALMSTFLPALESLSPGLSFLLNSVYQIVDCSSLTPRMPRSFS